jgi:hypothetical protein
LEANLFGAEAERYGARRNTRCFRISIRERALRYTSTGGNSESNWPLKNDRLSSDLTVLEDQAAGPVLEP